MVADRIATDGAELSARVRFGTEELTLYFRLPADGSPALDASPFLPTLLPLAMSAGEPLRIDGPVSPRLLGAVGKIQEIFRSLWPGRLKRIEVAADSAEAKRGRQGTLCFFTRGVDSWYSVLTFEQPIDSLVHVTGLDPVLSPDRLKRAERDTADAARAAGHELMLVDTNVRELSDRLLDWPAAHGAVMAGIGLALAPDRMLVPGTLGVGDICAWGSHPLLDPRWSTERTEIVHHGESTRLDKVREVVRCPLVLETLKVCWEADTDANCGRCLKCLHTMSALQVAGALDRCPRFDAPFEPRRLALVEPGGAMVSHWMREYAIAAQGADPEMALGLAVSRARFELRRMEEVLQEVDGAAAAAGAGRPAELLAAVARLRGELERFAQPPAGLRGRARSALARWRRARPSLRTLGRPR